MARTVAVLIGLVLALTASGAAATGCPGQATCSTQLCKDCKCRTSTSSLNSLCNVVTTQLQAECLYDRPPIPYNGISYSSRLSRCRYVTTQLQVDCMNRTPDNGLEALCMQCSTQLCGNCLTAQSSIISSYVKSHTCTRITTELQLACLRSSLSDRTKVNKCLSVQSQDDLNRLLGRKM